MEIGRRTALSLRLHGGEKERHVVYARVHAPVVGANVSMIREMSERKRDRREREREREKGGGETEEPASHACPRRVSHHASEEQRVMFRENAILCDYVGLLGT